MFGAIGAVLGTIFGSKEVIKSGIDLIDDIHTSDEEEIQAKAKAKIDILKGYEPFKVTQRYLALMFTSVFLFIMLNGIVGALYGWIDMTNVSEAKQFASDMWLGEIMIAIISFYFGGGFIESINRKDKK
jgi:hypothetical protein